MGEYGILRVLIKVAAKVVGSLNPPPTREQGARDFYFPICNFFLLETRISKLLTIAKNFKMLTILEIFGNDLS